MARNDAVHTTNNLNRLGRAWLAERGDREAIKVRYPWGFDGPIRDLPSDLEPPAVKAGVPEIKSLGNEESLEEALCLNDQCPLDLTFSDDWSA